FSSRRRHTRFSRDWSSDVCSSDLQIRDESIHLLRPILLSRVAFTLVKNKTFDNADFLGFFRQVQHPVVTAGATVGCAADGAKGKIGRASCRERVEMSVGAGAVEER